MKRFTGIKLCVFDAYGTLFDVTSPIRRAKRELGARAEAVSALWRTKQLEYTWLRSLMGKHVDFWRVTGDALDYALAASGVRAAGVREKIMRGYLALDVYPDVRPALKRLNAKGVRCAILSNGTPAMLEAAVENVGLGDAFAAVLSIEPAGIYKPHPATYRLVTRRFRVAPRAVSFQTANAWDAAGAKAFGFRVAWINRMGRNPERLALPPDAALRSLTPLPRLLGAAPARNRRR